MEILQDSRNYFDRDDHRIAGTWNGGGPSELTNNIFERPVYTNPVSNIPNVDFTQPTIRQGHIREKMRQSPVDGKITDDTVPKGMVQSANFGLYKDDMQNSSQTELFSRRREQHSGDFNNLSRKFNQLGNSQSKNKHFDVNQVPIFKKKFEEQEVNPHNLHSKEHDPLNAVYGCYKTAKRHRVEDIDQKHFADRYGTEYVEHWGKSKNHSAVHQREMKESDQWQKKQKIPFDKRAYNNFNQEPKNTITRNENISLNANEIHLGNYLNSRHTHNMKYYDRPEREHGKILPDGNVKRFEADIEWANRDIVNSKQGFIPKYQGFVPSINAENLYGETFAKTTANVHNGNHFAGPDHYADLKYQTTYGCQFPQKPNGSIVPLKGTAEYARTRPNTVDLNDMSDTHDSFNNSKNLGFRSTNSISVEKDAKSPFKMNRTNNRSMLTQDSNRKADSILKDGETKKKRNLVRLYNQRKKTVANTDSKDKTKSHFDHTYGRNTHSYAFKQGMDLNSHGTNRQNYIKELNDKKELWETNPELIENFNKVKDTTEFKREFPKVAVLKGPHTKYGSENYNYHKECGKTGYARHKLGYAWHYK